MLIRYCKESAIGYWLQNTLLMPCPRCILGVGGVLSTGGVYGDDFVYCRQISESCCGVERVMLSTISVSITLDVSLIIASLVHDGINMVLCSVVP